MDLVLYLQTNALRPAIVTDMTLGQLVYEDNPVQAFGQGKGIRSTGALAVTTVAPP